MQLSAHFSRSGAGLSASKGAKVCGRLMPGEKTLKRWWEEERKDLDTSKVEEQEKVPGAPGAFSLYSSAAACVQCESAKTAAHRNTAAAAVCTLQSAFSRFVQKPASLHCFLHCFQALAL